MAPSLPHVEHKPIVIPREMVGNTSNVNVLFATVNMEVQNFPRREKTTAT